MSDCNYVSNRELRETRNFTDAELSAYCLGNLHAWKIDRRGRAVEEQGLSAPPCCPECGDWLAWNPKYERWTDRDCMCSDEERDARRARP